MRGTEFEGQLLRYLGGDILANVIRTARGVKAKILSESIQRTGLEFVQVDDIVTSDLTEALKGMCSRISRSIVVDKP